MQMTTRRFFLITLFALLLASCSSQTTEPVIVDRLEVNNDEAQLSGRIHYYDDTDVELTLPEDANGASKTRNTGANASATKISIKLRAEVDPPTVDGVTVHANHVTFNKKNAYVSYHTKSSMYRGAVDIFNIEIMTRPLIRSQGLFKDTDVTIAVQDEGILFLGEATDSRSTKSFKSPAALEIIKLNASRITKDSERIDLPSFNANDIDCFDETIFVTTGTTDGSLLLFPRHSGDLEKSLNISGAKAVEKTSDHVMVLEGTGTRLHLYERGSLDFIKTIDLGCSNNFQNKAELAVHDGIVFISAETCGVMALDVANETVVYTIPPPPGGVINSISITGDLAFLANGKDGLQVIEIDDEGYTVLGTAKFDGSTNFVGANEKAVFVANGSGGLKILEIVD